jgi:hypothetical protein
MTIIVVICCICGEFIGKKDGEGKSGISHGYCDACLEKEMKKVKSINLESKGGAYV